MVKDERFCLLCHKLIEINECYVMYIILSHHNKVILIFVYLQFFLFLEYLVVNFEA